MIVLDSFIGSEKLYFINSTELKEMLKFCNPTMLRFYRKQIENRKFIGLNFFIKIEGMGEEIKINTL